MNLKEQIKILATEKEMTLKELSAKANMNYTGLLDKFRRNSLTVRDLQRLLDVLDKQIVFVDKQKP